MKEILYMQALNALWGWRPTSSGICFFSFIPGRFCLVAVHALSLRTQIVSQNDQGDEHIQAVLHCSRQFLGPSRRSTYRVCVPSFHLLLFLHDAMVSQMPAETFMAAFVYGVAFANLLQRVPQ